MLVGSLGGPVDASLLTGFVAELDGEPVGLVTVTPRRDECELVTLGTAVESRGVG